MSDEFDDLDSEQSDPELTTINLGDPKSVSKARDKQKRQQELAAAFWQAVFANPVGRREMFALLQSAHAFEERFACGPTGFPDQNATFFHAGEQAFGMRLFLSWLKMAPDGVHEMLHENDPRFAKPKRSSR